jgi:hypothetical protein
MIPGIHAIQAWAKSICISYYVCAQNYFHSRSAMM